MPSGKSSIRNFVILNIIINILKGTNKSNKFAVSFETGLIYLIAAFPPLAGRVRRSGWSGGPRLFRTRGNQSGSQLFGANINILLIN